MTTVVCGRFDVDSDETYIDDATMNALEAINEKLVDGFAGEAAVMLGKLLDWLAIANVIHERENRELYDLPY